ncbi:MAG: hypothetical protein HGA86_04560 [Anaerolineaceae bacterium]|nr:hypothetical protein [Anaerolineaceae bacterium]
MLVWPKHGKLLRKPIDLVLIQRQARTLGMTIALVSQDSVILNRADELNIPVYSSVEEAQQNFLPVEPDPRQWISRSRKGYQALTEEKENLKTNGFLTLRYRWQRTAVFSAGVIAVLLLVLLFIPSANIQLPIQETLQNMTISVWTSPGSQSIKLSGAVPSHEVKVVVEGQDESATTGSVMVPDTFATGTIEIRNLTLDPQEIPVGTVIRTLDTDPIRYETTQAVSLPGGIDQKLSTPIKAIKPGITGNQPSGSIVAIEGNIGTRIAINNPEPAIGGTDQPIPAASEMDVELLRQRVLTLLGKNAEVNLKAQLTDGELLLPGTVKQTDIKKELLEPEQNQPSDRIKITLQVEFSALVVRESDVNLLAEQVLDANLPVNYHPVQDTQGFIQTSDPAADPDGTLRWKIFASRTIQANWSEKQIVQSLVGLPRSKVPAALKFLSLSDEPLVTMSPSWWPLLPVLPLRIHVEVP